MRTKPYGGSSGIEQAIKTAKDPNFVKREEQLLAGLLRNIILDKNITPQKYAARLFEFITNPINGIPNNRRAQTSERGNIAKEIRRPTMTLKVFCKFMRLLGFRKWTMIIVGEDADGVVSRHSIDVDYSKNQEAYEHEPVLCIDPGEDEDEEQENADLARQYLQDQRKNTNNEE